MKFAQTDEQQRLVADNEELLVHLQNEKTSPRAGRVQGVVLHYTAVRAGSRPRNRLEQFRAELGAEYDAVDAFVAKQGRIPPALMLSLGNAKNRLRKASWDFTVGQDGLIVQCNLTLSRRCTWHAGRTLAGKDGYVMKHGSRNVFDYRNALVYDGATKSFAGPVLPDGQIMQSGNPPTIGIEVENWGRLDKHNGLIGRFAKRVFRPIPGLTAQDLQVIDGKLYEPIPDAQYRALIGLCRALRDLYRIPQDAWFGHRQITPDKRTDPDPPLHLERLVADIYADTIEVVAANDDDDVEDLFIGDPLADNAST